MKINKFNKLTTEIWDHGSYLSTRIDDHKVINTFEYDGYFFDLVYDVAIHEIVDVRIDDTFTLNIDQINKFGYKINLN
jgi:hypothetical protein